MTQIECKTEPGDLGLGFDELNDKDTKAYNEAMNNNSSNNQTVINENKDNK